MRRKTERSKTSSQSSPEKITRRSSRRGRKSPSKSPEPSQEEETIHEAEEGEEPRNSSDSDSDAPIKTSINSKSKDIHRLRQVEIENENGDDKEKCLASPEEVKKTDKSVTPEPEVVNKAKESTSENNIPNVVKEALTIKEKQKPLSRSKESAKRRSRSSSSSSTSSSSSGSSTKSRNRRVSRDPKSVTPDHKSLARPDSSLEKSRSPEIRKIESIKINKTLEKPIVSENNKIVRERRSRSRRDSSTEEKNPKELCKERNRLSKSPTPEVRQTRRASVKSDDQPVKEIEIPAAQKSIEASKLQELVDDEMKENLPEKAGHIDEQEARELKKSISVESDKNDSKMQPTVRKRKWLSRKNSEQKPPILAISTDSLKNLISDVKPVPLSDVKLESSPEINRDEQLIHIPIPHVKESRSGKGGGNTNNVSNKEGSRPRKSSIEDVDLDKTSGHKDDQSITKNRKVSVMSEESLSPPKHELSSILYITNLVRPFTVLQLKGLLARTGKIVENGFWIDKIKSRCYVKYENEDEATETRHALHGVRWPTSNPKCLHVDFGTEIGFQKALETTAEESQKMIDGRGGKLDKDFGWDKDIKDSYDKDKEAIVKPVREWDVGKKETGLDRSRDRDRDRDRERSKDRMRHDRKKRSQERDYPRDRDRKRSHSTSPARKFKKKENEPPLRLLDDLFRKTKATPCIYWLPLTAELIAVKEEIRRNHMAEHQRRIEEIRKQEEERDREREKEREKKRERDREREREREKNRDRSNDRRRDRSRSKERDGDRRRYR